MTPSVVTVFAATQIFTALLLHRTPGWSPVGTYFTVTVPPSFPASREGRRILRRFRVRVWAHCAISLALCLAVVASGRTVWLVPALLWLPVFSLAAVAQARRRVLPHAAPASLIREASLVPQRTALPGGPLAQAGPFLILAGAALVLWARRNALHAITTTGSRAMPDAFPFGMLAVATLSCGVVLGTALLTQRWARDPYPAVRLSLLGVLLGVEYLIAVTFVLPFLGLALGWTRAAPWLEIVIVAGGLAVTAPLVAAAARARAAGSARDPGDRTPDACWKWGLFYVNRDDAAIFVPKRFGIGYTLNFGQPWAWAILAGLLGFVVISAVVPGLLAGR